MWQPMGKKFKPPQGYSKKRLRLKDNHTWQAPKGYKILVLERGVVSLNIPEKWNVVKTQPNVELHDAPPPDDNARLSISFWRLPPGVDWTGLPLKELLEKSTEGSSLEILERGEIITSKRTDLEMVWRQDRFLDPVEKRDAFTRIMMARGWDVHALITFDFWVDDALKLEGMWDELMRSLQLGRYIEDPTKGVTLH